MSELTDLIDRFLEKYPDDAVLEWEGKPPDIGSDTNPKHVWARDLVSASEKWKARK